MYKRQIDDNEKGLKSDFANIGIGAGGGVPNRILTPKKAGTLTITGTIYRNGKAFKTVTKTVKITNKVSVKMTTLSSVKNVKGKKMLVKWKKNTSGNGYQIQYSTSSKFAKGNKTKTISKNSTTSCTISKLSKNKTYYVRCLLYTSDIFSLLGISNIGDWIERWMNLYEAAIKTFVNKFGEEESRKFFDKYSINTDISKTTRYIGYSIQQYSKRKFKNGERPTQALSLIHI